jgi:hypothetical protein
MMSVQPERVDLHKEPLFRLLAELDLDRDHFVIFGSAPLYVRGIIPQIGDLDLVARGPAWEKASRLGVPLISQNTRDPIIHFYGGKIEIFREWWTPRPWTTDVLIDHADWIAGFRFARLEYVLTYKWYLNRPKDQPHLESLRQSLGSVQKQEHL